MFCRCGNIYTTTRLDTAYSLRMVKHGEKKRFQLHDTFTCQKTGEKRIINQPRFSRRRRKKLNSHLQQFNHNHVLYYHKQESTPTATTGQKGSPIVCPPACELFRPNTPTRSLKAYETRVPLIRLHRSSRNPRRAPQHRHNLLPPHGHIMRDRRLRLHIRQGRHRNTPLLNRKSPAGGLQHVVRYLPRLYTISYGSELLHDAASYLSSMHGRSPSVHNIHKFGRWCSDKCFLLTSEDVSFGLLFYGPDARDQGYRNRVRFTVMWGVGQGLLELGVVDGESAVYLLCVLATEEVFNAPFDGFQTEFHRGG